MFSKEELNRYSRHITLPDFGMEGQAKLKGTSVLVVGAGGLGSPVLMYLAAAGIGKIGIVDDDKVDETNLQRQVIYGHGDIGRYKVIVAQEKIKDINPHIEVEVYQYRLTKDNALGVFADYDIIADGTDNFATRYLVNDACVLLDKVNVFASIYRYDGQVAVFNAPLEQGRSIHYRDIFPAPPAPEDMPNCAEGGVIGVLPGIIGAMQATEVIKIAAEIGEPLIGKMFIFDALTFQSRLLKYSDQASVTPVTELLEDYNHYCKIRTVKDKYMQLKEITVQELKEMQDANEDFKFIDVREKREFDFVNMGAELIQLGKVLSEGEKFEYAEDKKVVVHCRSGKRSGDAILALQEKYGYENLYNLKGGIIAYANEIDKSLPTY